MILCFLFINVIVIIVHLPEKCKRILKDIFRTPIAPPILCRWAPSAKIFCGLPGLDTVFFGKIHSVFWVSPLDFSGRKVYNGNSVPLRE